MIRNSVVFDMGSRVTRVHSESPTRELPPKSVEDLTLNELSAAVREVREAAAGMDFEEWTSAQRERVGHTLRRILAA